MPDYQYVGSDEDAGLNDLILRSHPGGAIVEVGGGRDDRFKTHRAHPTVINIDKAEGAAGDIVLDADLNHLADGLNDERVQRLLLEHRGMGTAILSHVLYDLRPERITELIRTSVANILEGGNVWVMRVQRERMNRAFQNTFRQDFLKLVSEKEKLREQADAIDSALQEASQTCSVRSGYVLPLVRNDCLEDKKSIPKSMERAFQKISQDVKRGRMCHVLTESCDVTKDWNPCNAATRAFTGGAYQVTVLTKGDNEKLEQGWSALLQKQETVQEQFLAWLKAERKKKRR